MWLGVDSSEQSERPQTRSHYVSEDLELISTDQVRNPLLRGEMRSLETRHSGQPTTELVPIQELLYRGQRAIERAAEIRRALKKSGTPPTRALVDELVDLVELASAE